MGSPQLDAAIELARADDYAQAVEQLSSLIEGMLSHEDKITARRWRSVCNGQLGHLSEALTDANWLIDQGCDELHAWRAHIRERLRDFEGAIVDYSYAIADTSDKPDAEQYQLFLKRGHAYFLIKRYSDALADFTTALSFADQPRLREAAHIWRGNTYIELDDLKAAAEEFRTAEAIARASGTNSLV